MAALDARDWTHTDEDVETLCRRCHQKITGRRFKDARALGELQSAVLVAVFFVLVYLLTR
ncbi:MAG: hypothetical protein JO249_12585 [Acidobacteria bacterium]|nr:hypothetical protein [Acidobacteriota bacterium]